jgi:hypothetical protein
VFWGYAEGRKGVKRGHSGGYPILDLGGSPGGDPPRSPQIGGLGGGGQKGVIWGPVLDLVWDHFWRGYIGINGQSGLKGSLGGAPKGVILGVILGPVLRPLLGGYGGFITRFSCKSIAIRSPGMTRKGVEKESF